ncbi:dihydroneopterin aldolase [Bacillus sp. FJAT-18017]|uniref:dihydroneopterin aldolase n=1 Tax=Bacillus sp. FJAT-18017 TaxID=1705566 RepID=UPI0006AF0881|nr:dihydroneopterin aldolase [Bacillus sp. FJAT-18017]ALC88440.1 dihydroneopterin aldolase [Bacillus sp. FJAT-18017]
MDKIYVNRMEFYGYHGVFPEETRLGQRFAVDLAVGLSLEKAGLSDNLEESVNYGELFRLCKEVVEGDPFKLIEAVAEKIASRVLQEFPLIMEVMVKVIKPDPPIPGHYRSVAVEITRRR